MESPAANLQLRTRDAGAQLITELVQAPLTVLQPGQIRVEMLYVPMHGSFWLASHPQGLHPRKREFLQEGSFVFGSGGIGRVLEASGSNPAAAGPGDYVTLFGHVPCSRLDCHPCWQLHRYVECEHAQSHILGHGKGAPDGSYARYLSLPAYSYEVAYRAQENPDESQLLAMMFAYLFADVRNAWSRLAETSQRQRMLLFGAGQSGLIAAHLHLSSGPQQRLLAVDPDLERARRVQALDPQRVAIFQLPSTQPSEIANLAQLLAGRCRQHFQGKSCDLVFDAASGDATPLWARPPILSPGCLCIAFGFGSQGLNLTPELLQLSGLTVLTSRGVGDLDNRRIVVERLRSDWAPLSRQFLSGVARRLSSLEEALGFIQAQHQPPRPLHEIPAAYITPNPLSLPRPSASEA